MAKGVKKKVAKKKTTSSKPKKQTVSRADRNLEKILIENFISMQKIMTSFVTKFDKLEKQISSMLELFEESAKTIAEKEINLELKGDEERQEEILNKLKDVLDQNKLIAKGITLMHESSVSRVEPERRVNVPPQNKPLPTGFMPSQINNDHHQDNSSREINPHVKKKIVKEEDKNNSSDSSVNFSI